MIRLALSLTLLLAMLAGCGEVVVFGHVVREAPGKTEPVAAAPPPAVHTLHAVNLTVAPEAKSGDPSIAADALLDAIRTELRSRKLLDEQNPNAAGTADI